MKSSNPTLIFIPRMIATFVATVVRMIAVAILQCIKLFNRVVIGWIGSISIMIGGLIYFFRTHPAQIDTFSKVLSNGLLLFLFTAFIIGGLVKK